MESGGNTTTADEYSAERLAEYRARVLEIRERTRQLFEGGATGIQLAADCSEATDALIVDLLRDACAGLSPDERSLLDRHSVVIAVGGSGRGELAPYSDSDLLFLFDGPVERLFGTCTAQVVRDCWDTGIKLGHSVRTIADTISMGRQEPQFATALVEARQLWGSESLFEKFRRKVIRRAITGRKRTFILEAVENRRQEWMHHGGTVNRLEPDVKRSLGGLRDVHLIRWVGFAHYETADIHSLRLRGALSKEDARILLAAQEFLLRIRIDLHLAANRPHDVLTRDEQLRIAQQRQIEATAGLRPVERFMQTYFQHSMAIAEITRRFVSLHRPKTLTARLFRSVMTHRANGIFKVGPDAIDVFARNREFVVGRLDEILKLFHTAVLYSVSPTPQLIERLKQSVPCLEPNLSETSIRLFLKILGSSRYLGAVLRTMYDIGLLELMIPAMTHARCLLQFNQYHSYTVDEHTLQAVETAAGFERDDGPLGAAYRAVGHKELLHLALLLHDLGKGFEEDHSDVGREIAERTADRLHLSEHQREILVFLVHHHLTMAHLAFRRDIADPELLLGFSRLVGSPELLRMLYVLTAADMTAVGPGVWTGWKAELLTELYDRVMLILSGKHYQYHEQERLESIKEQVRAVSVSSSADSRRRDWLNEQLDAFPIHYLVATEPERIAADLELMRRLEPGDVTVEGRFLPETGTIDYRVITQAEMAEGCFHKIAGVLTAKRLTILTAQISTSTDGTIVDSFRVHDADYTGSVPDERIDEIGAAIRQVLAGDVTVEALFERHRRFGGERLSQPISDLPMRVVIDNDSSDRCTIIDVFAHDRSGLLYNISRVLYRLGLSVMRAKIATHLDQVVDVFYVTDSQGKKIEDGDRLREIQTTLVATIEDLERQPVD